MYWLKTPFLGDIADLMHILNPFLCTFKSKFLYKIEDLIRTIILMQTIKVKPTLPNGNISFTANLQYLHHGICQCIIVELSPKTKEIFPLTPTLQNVDQQCL